MKQLFILEWFKDDMGKYIQEYFLTAESAFDRFLMIRDHISKDVTISMGHVHE